MISPFVPIPHINAPIFRSGTALRVATALSWPRFPNHLNDIGFNRPELVINGTPVATSWALSLEGTTTAYRLADDLRLFNVVTPIMHRLETQSLPQYDVIIVTSNGLLEKAQREGARSTYLMTNGVDRPLFATPTAKPPEASRIKGPIILYAGAVEKWFDWKTLIAAAQLRPAYAFVILGRISAAPPEQLPTNIHILGHRPYADIPGFMQWASVGIIPFLRLGAATDCINPLKLYEYLAAGLPVVSSIKPPTKLEFVEAYETLDEFLDALDRAVKLAGTKIASAPPSVDWVNIVSDFLRTVNLPTADAKPSKRFV